MHFHVFSLLRALISYHAYSNYFCHFTSQRSYFISRLFESFYVYLLCFMTFHCISTVFIFSAHLFQICIILIILTSTTPFHCIYLLCVFISYLCLIQIIFTCTCSVLRHFTVLPRFFLHFFSSLRSYVSTRLFQSFLRLTALFNFISLHLYVFSSLCFYVFHVYVHISCYAYCNHS